MEAFIDPYSKKMLSTNSEGDLYYQNGNELIIYVNENGTYDFVHPSKKLTEKMHYDIKYRELGLKKLTVDDIHNPWFDEILPEYTILLKSLGDLSGKRVLLLGNGTSFKELYFAFLGADVVYTDLSIESINRIKGWFNSSEFKNNIKGNIEFHAVNALHLPFPDESFDIIYGCAFAHHIEDLYRLMIEVKRCLKKGGICRFLDDAYSPFWQGLKKTILKPLQMFTHWKSGISPEDQRATKRGGYKKDEIRKLMVETDLEDMMFIRISFFLRLFRKGIGNIIGWDPVVFRRARTLLKFMKWVDERLENSRFMRNNLINLVWGFTK